MKEGAIRMKTVIQAEEQTLRENDRLLQSTLASTSKQAKQLDAALGGASDDGPSASSSLLPQHRWPVVAAASMVLSGVYEVIVRALWMALVLGATVGTLFLVVLVPQGYETIMIQAREESG